MLTPTLRDDLAVLDALALDDGTLEPTPVIVVSLLDARPEAWAALLRWLDDARAALLASAPCSDPGHHRWDALALWDATEPRVRAAAGEALAQARAVAP